LQKVLAVKPDADTVSLKFEVQMKDSKDTIGNFNFQLQIREKKVHPVLIIGFQWKKSRAAFFRNNEYQSIKLYDLTVPGQLKEALGFISKIYEKDRLGIQVVYSSPDGGNFPPFTTEIPYRRKIGRLHRYLEMAVIRGLMLKEASRKNR